jgi:hypothetical protein
MPNTEHNYSTSQSNVKIEISDELCAIVQRWRDDPGMLSRVDAAVSQSVNQYPPDEWAALSNFEREVNR